MNSAPDRLKSLFERRSLAKTDVSRSETHGFLKNAQDYMDLLEKADSAAQKFLCAYNAAHAYATVALRLKGYRPAHRRIAFECLEQTTNISYGDYLNFMSAHAARNKNLYDGLPLGWDPDIYADTSQAVDEYCRGTQRLAEDVLQTVRNHNFNQNDDDEGTPLPPPPAPS